MRGGARMERRVQFDDIDRMLDAIGTKVDALKQRLEYAADDDWTMTGNGGDLAQIQAQLRTILGEGEQDA